MLKVINISNNKVSAGMLVPYKEWDSSSITLHNSIGTNNEMMLTDYN